eukprot:Rhum_TRINITY_DN7938_c0_g1::Rhum_TRINITY_DN7938_c0_g1_i1::g.25080::m.25080
MQFGIHHLLQRPPDVLDYVVLSGAGAPPKPVIASASASTPPTAPKVTPLPPPLPATEKGMRYDRVLLGSSVVTDEAQLCAEVLRSVPSLAHAQVRYEDDCDRPGSKHAVLLMAYADPAQHPPARRASIDSTKGAAAPGKAAPAALPTSPRGDVACVNAGREGLVTSAVPAAGGEPAWAHGSDNLKKPLSTDAARTAATTSQAVEMITYLAVTILFVVPLCLLWCWAIKYFYPV